MKTARLISTTIASIIVSFAMLMPASAVDAGNVGVATAAVTGTGVQAYIMHVMNDIAGRAGTGTITGTRGVVLEVLVRDKMNIQNFFTGVRTTLSESSIDSVVDLVSKKGNEVVQLLQCKDPGTVESAKTMLNNIDKYASTDIVTSAEGAQNFMTAAEATGKEIDIINSGVSSQKASAIAKLYKGKANFVDLSAAAQKTAGISSAFSAAIATAEAIYYGYDFDEALGFIIVETAEGTLVGYISGLAAAGTTAALAGAGITTTAAIAVPVVAGGAVAFAGAEALNYVSEKTNAKETVSSWVSNVQEYTVNGYHTVCNKIEQSKTLNSIGSIAANVKDGATSLCRNIAGK